MQWDRRRHAWRDVGGRAQGLASEGELHRSCQPPASLPEPEFAWGVDTFL